VTLYYGVVKITSTSSVVIYGSSLHLAVFCPLVPFVVSLRISSSLAIHQSTIFHILLLLFQLISASAPKHSISKSVSFPLTLRRLRRHLWFIYPSSVIFISLFGSIHHLFGAALGIYHLWFVGGWSGGLAGLNYIACSDRIRRLCIPLRYSILDYTLHFVH